MNKTLKNFSVFVVFLVMMVSLVFLPACDTSCHSKADIDDVYSTILDDFCDSKGYIAIGVSSSKVVQTTNVSDDKYYIFPLLLDNYVSYASGAVFGVASRQDGILLSLNGFSQDELNDVYDGFSSVLASLQSLDEVKSVYENSNGRLRYQDLINAYFDLIDKLYSLSDTFSSCYFEDTYTGNFTETVVEKGSLSDIFWYELEVLSKVSYRYDLQNYVVDESDGAVVEWYDSSTVLKSFMLDTADLLSALKVDGNLAQSITTSNKTTLTQLVNNMFDGQNAFEENYNSYVSALANFDLSDYLVATNKQSYLQNCTYREQGSFSIIVEFLNGRYSAFMSAVSSAISKMNV